MRPDRGSYLPPWAVFAIPAVTVVAITIAILLAGPLGGFAAALVAAAIVVVVAIRPHASASAPWLRHLLVRGTAVLALATAGIVVAATTHGTAQAIGWGLVAVAITLALSLVFLEVGYSEERDRRRRGT